MWSVIRRKHVFTLRVSCSTTLYYMEGWQWKGGGGGVEEDEIQREDEGTQGRDLNLIFV